MDVKCVFVRGACRRSDRGAPAPPLKNREALSRDVRGPRRALKSDGESRRAAEVLEPREVFLHLAVFANPGHDFREDLRGARVFGRHDAVVHPLAFTSRRDDPGASQVREVSRNLRLVHPQHFDEVADADLAPAHQVQQAQTSPVGQSLEEQFHLARLLRHPYSTPTTSLRRSNRTVSRQRPPSRPTRSRLPTSRKPHARCSRTLATFSGKMPACKVQTPLASDSRIKASSSARPKPLPRNCAPT